MTPLQSIFLQDSPVRITIHATPTEGRKLHLFRVTMRRLFGFTIARVEGP